jgi:hypothetical protein
VKAFFLRILLEVFLYNDYRKDYWQAKNRQQQLAAMSKYSAARLLTFKKGDAA